ncbi:MAG TPA: hypothetical protein VMX18_04785 [Candidatus Bipolaricaulota bacterium]|nr:hypothetical protein [Candidatus Bipolaricaulota bacterium]
MFKSTMNNNLLSFLTILISRYEKILLKNHIIDQSEITITRVALENEINQRDLSKIKEAFVSSDPEYLMALTALIEKEYDNKRDFKIKKEELINIFYYKNYRMLKRLMKEVESKNIEESNESADKWLEDKYGKNFFNEE